MDHDCGHSQLFLDLDSLIEEDLKYVPEASRPERKRQRLTNNSFKMPLRIFIRVTHALFRSFLVLGVLVR